MTRFGGIPELPDKAGMWIVLGRELWGLACLCRRMGLGLVPGLSKSFGGSMGSGALCGSSGVLVQHGLRAVRPCSRSTRKRQRFRERHCFACTCAAEAKTKKIFEFSFRMLLTGTGPWTK
jgi:hypothetical protein